MCRGRVHCHCHMRLSYFPGAGAGQKAAEGKRRPVSGGFLPPGQKQPGYVGELLYERIFCGAQIQNEQTAIKESLSNVCLFVKLY